jgi:hypothetical protein
LSLAVEIAVVATGGADRWATPLVETAGEVDGTGHDRTEARSHETDTTALKRAVTGRDMTARKRTVKGILKR